MKGRSKKMEPEISILVLFNDIKTVKDLLVNIKENSYFSKIEIILLDQTQEDNLEVKEILNRNSNVIYIEVKEKNKAEAYNIGLENATGKYISFIEQDNTYSKQAIKQVERYIRKNKAKMVSLKPYYLQEDKVKPYKMAPNKCKEVDLNFMPLKLNLALDSYFIHRNLIRKFDETLSFEDAKMKFLLETFMRYPFYYFMRKTPIYYKVPKEDDTSANFMQYDKGWYHDSLTHFVIPFLEKHYKTNEEIPIYVQEALLYYIFAKYNSNLKDRNKMVLNKEEAKEFFETTATAMQYIHSRLILSLNKNSLFKIPRWLGYQFVLEKNKKLNIKTKIKVKKDEEEQIDRLYLYEQNDEITMNLMEKEHIILYAINEKKNQLEFDFNLSMQDIVEEKDIEVFVKYGEKMVKAQKTNCYPLLKVFGLTVSKQIPFHVAIDIENKNETIQFYVQYQKNTYPVSIKYEKVQTHLNNSKYSYWRFGKQYYLCNKQKYLKIEKRKVFSGLIKELKYFAARILRAKDKIFTMKYFALRFAYFCVKPFYQRKTNLANF